jgi:hypothetical protein
VNVGRQGHTALDQWGLPAVLLAALGAFGKGVPELRRGLVAWGCAGVLLALTAVFSPLEVRYLYALTLPLAIVGAEGLEALLDRGTGGVAVAALLLLWQTALAAQGIVEGVLRRYRA